MTERLSAAALESLPAQVLGPLYNRGAIQTGVVHLGIGAFHRAHQAIVFDDALNGGDLRWGICAASLRSGSVRDTLVPQDCLYSVVIRDAAAESVRLVGAVRDVIVAPEDPRALVEAMAAPTTHIVTLTITEKGYKLDPASGRLIESDPDVASDLVALDAPSTAPGLIVAAMAVRKHRNLPPFTAISCDNLPHNGQRLRDAVLAIARRQDPSLAEWIAERGAFPQTMVDRIVPATDDSDIEALAERIGIEDRAMVKTEPFLQWVIEDHFCGPRPDFSTTGVQLTRDVAPWEEAKLRLLNGAHSGIAYLGGLAGVDYVDQFVDTAEGHAFVEMLWNEAEPTLTPPPELDIAAYRRDLMARFTNPTLKHRTRQIAMDGSQKIPQRLFAPIQMRIDRGEDYEALALAVAAWMRWQQGRTDDGETFTVDDPLADETARRLQGLGAPADQVGALLKIEAIFSPRLAADTGFAATVGRHLESLVSKGAKATLTAFVGAADR